MVSLTRFPAIGHFHLLMSSTQCPSWGTPTRTVIREVAAPARCPVAGSYSESCRATVEIGSHLQMGQLRESTVWGCHPPRCAGTPT